jgi:hypothetical protein
MLYQPIKPKETERDLSQPIGMLGEQKRKEIYIQRF